MISKKQKIDSKTSHINYGLINACSIINKTETIVDFILEHDLDILSITETWLKSDDSFSVSNVTPPGFSILSCPRLCKRG